MAVRPGCERESDFLSKSSQFPNYFWEMLGNVGKCWENLGKHLGDIPAPKRCRLRSESTEMVTGRRNEHKATGVFSFMQDTCNGTFTEPFIIA